MKKGDDNFLVRIYTDGSYKDGFVGYGFLIEGIGIHEILLAKVSRPGTVMMNVEAELRAVLYAMRYLYNSELYKKITEIVFYYDFEGVVDLLRNKSAHRRNGFFRVYAEEFYRLAKAMQCEIRFEKVKGHSHPVHNKVDVAVRRKLRLYLSSMSNVVS